MTAFNKFILLSSAVATLSLSFSSFAAPAEPVQATQYPILTIQKHKDIRVAYDVKDDVLDAGVGKALYYVRGLLESYKSMGVSPIQLHISIIMHGPTAYWLLNETAYRLHKNDPFDFNPNEQIVRELLEHGVSVEICNSTMKSKGWTG